jgi:hypothetical protein
MTPQSRRVRLAAAAVQGRTPHIPYQSMKYYMDGLLLVLSGVPGDVIG